MEWKKMGKKTDSINYEADEEMKNVRIAYLSRIF